MSLLSFIFDDFLPPFRLSNRYSGSELNATDLIGPLNETRLLRCSIEHHSEPNDFGSNVSLDKDAIRISLDVKQFTPNEISVKITGDVITVEGKHKEGTEEKGFVSRQFVRKYLAPRGCNMTQVNSKLSSDGILTITAPLTDSNWDANKTHTVLIQQTGQPSKQKINPKSKL